MSPTVVLNGCPSDRDLENGGEPVASMTGNVEELGGFVFYCGGWTYSCRRGLRDVRDVAAESWQVM